MEALTMIRFLRSALQVNAPVSDYIYLVVGADTSTGLTKGVFGVIPCLSLQLSANFIRRGGKESSLNHKEVVSVTKGGVLNAVKGTIKDLNFEVRNVTEGAQCAKSELENCQTECARGLLSQALIDKELTLRSACFLLGH
ncbi:hypothetical protein Nepgr_018938 [Nepenthes gracilis]|uniref:Uncharacterized protein n=1 Tax=Nepenthes gracilis TaxID=150966 RepID=A0AAD3XTL0_NEPGR|nr:hypothetical protein Nepgr_018938 [Nepenthes gracilis]